MLMGVFALFDSKAGSYGMPFFTHNRGSAIRGIKAQISQDSSSMLAKYPEDFSLFDLGIYDEVEGRISGTSPVFIIDVSDILGGSNEQQP